MIADKDLISIQHARILVENAFEAQQHLLHFPQERLDGIVEAISLALKPHLETLAKLSHEETGYGCIEDKLYKNTFFSQELAHKMRPMRCVGFLEEHSAQDMRCIGVPLGVIVALCPSTNPISTTIYKSLLAIKSGNALIFSLHPKAQKCMQWLLDIMIETAHKHGLPHGALSYLRVVTKNGTEELIKHRHVALVLATGVSEQLELIKTSGKPYIYGGQGDGPAFIERSAHLAQAVTDIVQSKIFDYGMAPSAEKSVVVEGCIAAQCKSLFQEQGVYFMSDAESMQLIPVLFDAHFRQKKESIGQSAQSLAQMAGLSVPQNTKILMAERQYVRYQDPYAHEILAPVMAYYVEDNWQAACERCIEILLLEGKAHTLIIHSNDQAIIDQFALKKPVARILVNSPGVFGGIGAQGHLFPAMTLGSGLRGHGISSDNISPMHLTYKRHLVYGHPQTLPSYNPQTLVYEDDVANMVRTVITTLEQKKLFSQE